LHPEAKVGASSINLERRWSSRKGCLAVSVINANDSRFVYVSLPKASTISSASTRCLGLILYIYPIISIEVISFPPSSIGRSYYDFPSCLWKGVFIPSARTHKTRGSHKL
jgi:hypothetical protein